MKSFRFLLPFLLGALTMLALVIAAALIAPGPVVRMYAGLGGVSPPREAAAVVTAPPATAYEEAPVTGVRPSSPPPARASTPAVRASPSAPIAGGRLLIPVQGVEAASLVDTYDQARSEGRRHDAIDIIAGRGTPVLATADGVVMKLFRSERGGTTLYQLAPDRRTIYYYAHLDGYADGIVEGRTLRRGEVLGYVGDTGDAVPGNYHLHFEVSTTLDPAKYWGGLPQNPYPLLR